MAAKRDAQKAVQREIHWVVLWVTLLDGSWGSVSDCLARAMVEQMVRVWEESLARW